MIVIVAFLTTIDIPMIALSHLYVCLCIFKQDLTSEGMAKKIEIPHDLWVNSIHNLVKANSIS